MPASTSNKLVLSLTFKRDDAQDFAGMKVEACVGQFRRDGEVLDREARFARRPGARRLGRALAQVDLRAQHHLDHAVLDARRDIDIADTAPVAQDGGAVAKLRDLGEAVRDVDDAAPVLGLGAGHAQDAFHKVGRKCGGQFVEEQHVGRAGKRAGKVDDAQRGQRQVADHRVEP
jgi:hypothetical protein